MQSLLYYCSSNRVVMHTEVRAKGELREADIACALGKAEQGAQSGQSKGEAGLDAKRVYLVPSPYQSPQLPGARSRSAAAGGAGPAAAPRGPRSSGAGRGCTAGTGLCQPPGTAPVVPGAGSRPLQSGERAALPRNAAPGGCGERCPAAQPAGTRAPRGHRLRPRPPRRLGRAPQPPEH